jgi:hypothetical protein
MKKGFKVLVIIFAILLVVLLLIVAMSIPRGVKLNHGAVAYIKDAVPKGGSGKMAKVFDICRRLGSIKHLSEPEGAVYGCAYLGIGVATFGNYEAQAHGSRSNFVVSMAHGRSTNSEFFRMFSPRQKQRFLNDWLETIPSCFTVQ